MTQAEMLAEIARAMTKTPTKDGPVGVSANEYATARKLSIVKARIELQSLINAGKVRYAGKAPRLAMNGEWRPIPVYCPVKGK